MNQTKLSLEFLYKFLFSRRAGALIKIISWLSVCGIGIGVASLILVLSVMNGFNRSIRERKFSVEPHLVVYFSQKTVAEIEKQPVYEWLKKQKELKLDLTELQDVVLRTSEGFVQGAIAQGVSPQTLTVLAKQRSKLFRQESAEPIDLASGEVLMGAGLGDIMGLFEGDSLMVIPPETLVGTHDGVKILDKVKVKDFLQTEIDEIDWRIFYYEIGKALTRFRGTASLERNLEIRLADPEDYVSWQKQIATYGVRVESWKDLNSNLFYSLKMEKFVIGLLLGLSTLIASFSLVTVMVLLVTQKRKDIGLLLALGFPPLELRQVFTRVGVWLAGMGIFGGAFLGLIASVLVDRYSQGLLPNIYEETNIPAEIHWFQVVIVLLIAVLASLGTTWLSVRKMSEWQPAQALKS